MDNWMNGFMNRSDPRNPTIHLSNNPTIQSSRAFAVALVTAPNLKVARQLAKIILKSRLAACANLIPNIESHYWWKNKLSRSAEVLLILKTTQSRLKTLEKCVLKNHPYETPEFIVLKVGSGSKRYLEWIATSVTSENRS